ncbi:LysR family transcriptional regulator [Roseibium sp. SCP14]|uniref:LysR family transcriptional regulator n=1 Tax=Roseibium sp. SCP14 TaxID=3141375 RepID=UPI00333949FC
MDYNLFPVFVEIMRHQNLSKAGRALGMTQPAVSNALARLRDQFGDQLFIRASRGVIPTQFASDIGADIERHVEELKLLTQTQSRRSVELSKISRRFRLVAHDMEECLILPQVLAELSNVAPGMQIEVRPYNRATLADELTTGRADFVMAYLRDVHKNLISREMVYQDFVCVCRKNHPEVGKRPSLKQFVRLNHMIVSPDKGGFHGLVDEHLMEKGMSRNVTISVPHFLTACQFVARTDCILTLPRLVAEEGARAFGLHLFELPFKMDGFSTSLHWHRRLDNDPEHAAIRELILETLKKEVPGRQN